MMSMRPQLEPRRQGLIPSREDAPGTNEAVFEYSLRLSAQVVSLEAENIDMRDTKTRLLAENRTLGIRLAEMERDNSGLRDAGMANVQEKHLCLRRAQEVARTKQGEVMLLRNVAEQQRLRSEALISDGRRLECVNERLQAETTQLRKEVCSLEAQTLSMQSEISQEALSEAQAAGRRSELERRVDGLLMERRHLDAAASMAHVEATELRRIRNDLAHERGCRGQLGDELQAARAEIARLQIESQKLGRTASALHALHAEAEEYLHGEHPRLCGQLRNEGAVAAQLRGRVQELERAVGTLSRTEAALEAENNSLRRNLNAAEMEAHRCATNSVSLASQVTGAEQLADQQVAWRIEAEQHFAGVSAECARLRSHGGGLAADGAALRARLRTLEADNVFLNGHLRGAEVLVNGLHGECAGLSTQVELLSLERLSRRHRGNRDLFLTEEPPPAEQRRPASPPALRSLPAWRSGDPLASGPPPALRSAPAWFGGPAELADPRGGAAAGGTWQAARPSLGAWALQSAPSLAAWGSPQSACRSLPAWGSSPSSPCLGHRPTSVRLGSSRGGSPMPTIREPFSGSRD